MLLTIVLLIISPLRVKSSSVQKKTSQSDSWFTDFIGLVVISVLFYLAWGFGLPGTHPLHLGVTRVVLQVIFIVCNILQGLAMVVCYCQKVWRAYNLQDPGNFAHADENAYGMSDEGILFENPLAEHSIADDSLPDYDAVNFDFEEESEMKASDGTGEVGLGGDHSDEMKEDLTQTFGDEDQLDI